MNDSPVAITGATGFIGKHMVAALLAAGKTVLALHRRASADDLPRHERLLWASIQEAEAAFVGHRPGAVIHLATCYGAVASLSEMLASNVALPLRALELATANGASLFITTDTFFAKPAFNYPRMRSYTQSKSEFVRWAVLATQSAGCPKVVNARLEHVYGPGDGDQKFVPQLLKTLMAGQQVALTPGDQLRDFVHVDDVVAAYLTVLEMQAQLPRGLTEIEVGTGETHSVRDFVEQAKASAGSTSPLNFGALPYRDREIMQSVANTSALRALGWQHRHDIASGIRATLDVMRSNAAAVQFEQAGASQP